MKKIVCAPHSKIPLQLENETKYFSTYSNPRRENVGYFGSSLLNIVRKNNIHLTEEVFDFNTIALSVAAADSSLSRRNSADGWTRQIDLTVHVCNAKKWQSVKERLEKVLKFLTGDFWRLHFKYDGVRPPLVQNRLMHTSKYDCVSLLSGGVDSLVGAIDLVTSKRNPVFVSQIVRGDAKTQREYAQKIHETSLHFQLNHNIHVPKGELESTTRGRSIVFFAFAALASTLIAPQNSSFVEIYVPENGFISLNIPYNPGRMGSFSTKTTHPIYLSGIQEIWNEVGINARLIMPYKYKTKGELLCECKDQKLLKSLIFKSVSCGKYRVYKMQHCGRCIPCLIRRAAFQRWGVADDTRGGYYSAELKRINHGNADDVGAAATACILADQVGVQQLIAGNLSFSGHQNREEFVQVYSRGLNELRDFLLGKDIL